MLPKIGLCSCLIWHWLILPCIALRLKVEFRIGGWGGWWRAKSFSCQTQLSLNCVKLFWSCFGVGVLTIIVITPKPSQATATQPKSNPKQLSCGFDMIIGLHHLPPPPHHRNSPFSLRVIQANLGQHRITKGKVGHHRAT